LWIAIKLNLEKIYKLNDGSKQYFKVERLKGVFAWGFRINSSEPEEGLPLALLKILEGCIIDGKLNSFKITQGNTLL